MVTLEADSTIMQPKIARPKVVTSSITGTSHRSAFKPRRYSLSARVRNGAEKSSQPARKDAQRPLAVERAEEAERSEDALVLTCPPIGLNCHGFVVANTRKRFRGGTPLPSHPREEPAESTPVTRDAPCRQRPKSLPAGRQQRSQTHRRAPHNS